jgi:hypothetical protein
VGASFSNTSGIYRISVCESCLEDERYSSQDGGRKKGLEVDHAGLTADSGAFHRIIDRFRSRIHVALTARREPHSRLVARLEIP